MVLQNISNIQYRYCLNSFFTLTRVIHRLQITIPYRNRSRQQLRPTPCFTPCLRSRGITEGGKVVLPPCRLHHSARTVDYFRQQWHADLQSRIVHRLGTRHQPAHVEIVGRDAPHVGNNGEGRRKYRNHWT